MPFTLRGPANQSFRLGAGSAATPSLAFANATSTGFFLQNGNIGVSVGGVEKLRIAPDGMIVMGNIAAINYTGNGSQLLGVTTNTFVSNIQVAGNSSYVALDDTSVDTGGGGYIIVNGTGFIGGSMVLVDGIPATSTTVLSYTQLGAQVPAKAAGIYSVSVVRPDSISVNVPLGVTYSPFPVWSTSATLANVTKTVAFTQTLSATEASNANVTYALSSGSTLPGNVTLASNGLLTGNIVYDPGNTTVYSFSIDAVDTQFQNIPRTFGLTALTSLIAATGGTITTSGAYKIHTFTTNGTFTVSTNPFNKTFDVLVVAGGGGGATSGGGGAGGYVEGSYSVSVSSYSVVVGGGGSGGSGASQGGNGANSSVFSITALGGGGGGGNNTAPGGNGLSGGSGGGGGAAGSMTLTGGSGQQPGNASGGFGNAGGMNNGTTPFPGGGGGGAGGNGGDAPSSSTGGSGGVGRSSSISGVSTGYAGGGAGCAFQANGPGTSQAAYGGGTGGTTGSGGNGTANTGGGGGGGRYTFSGGSGGSGIVIVRYIP